MSEWFQLEVFAHELVLPAGESAASAQSWQHAQADASNPNAGEGASGSAGSGGSPADLVAALIRSAPAPTALGDTPLAPLALAFQFLDYPLLLAYGPPAGADSMARKPAGADAVHGSGAGGASEPQAPNQHPQHQQQDLGVVSFGSGKSCVFQEDADELQFVLCL
uniref:Uncharacterized protein n=1 Tax=Chlamydomonas euryale TaxID=1486919 RepID=A0A7R9VQ70_9CHLO|mmetsp:Transcript_41648/g.124502  ORF Transcript_41648/g.124502 Transcript_41648/m.124502 type:complete len:165 (+) Transcript_41648:140-634(+)